MAVNLVTLPHPVTLEGMTTHEAPPGGTIADFLDASGAWLVVLNGQLVPAEEWDRPLRDGDVLARRPRLAGDDTDPLRTVLQVALLVATFAIGPTALGLGLFKGGLLTAAVVVGGSLIINAIAPPRLPGLGREGAEAEPVYSLIGGANRARPYAPQLLVLGTHRVFPDLGAKEYATFGRAAPVGEAAIEYSVGVPPTPGFPLPVLPQPRAAAPGGSIDQYLHQIFHWGLGNLAVSDLRIGDTLLTDFEGVETQWNDADGAITLVAGNVDTEAGAALEDTDWVPRTSAAGTTRVELDFQAQLFRISDEGEPQSHSVTLNIEMWPASDTNAVRRFNLTLTHGKATPYRLTVPYDLDPAGEWTVRVKRTTAPADDARTYDEVVWAAIRSFQPDGADYGGQTRLGVRIRASGQLQGRIDRLSGSVDQLVPTWDGTQWVADQVSSNPAWLFRWYARGVREDGELLAGVGLAAMSIDDELLKRWGAWCDTHGLKCDYVLDRDLSHAEVLALIAQCGRASPSWQSGRLGTVYDEENRTPSFYYGPGNIVDGSMEVDWISGAIAEEIVVRYRDPDLDWQYNSVRRNVPRVTAPDRTATLTREGIVDRDQAAKECNLQAARQLYHRRRLRWQTGPEGLSRARGQVGHLSHALVDGGVKGRVLDGTTSTLTLSRAIPLPAAPAADRADDYLLLLLPDGALHTSVVSRGPGSTDPDETDVVTLATALPAALTAHGSIPLDTLWRYYPADVPPLKVKLVSVEPQSDGSVNLEAIDEVAEYYSAATSDLTVDLPPLRRRWPDVLGIEVSEELISTGNGYLVELTATLDVAGDWRGGEIFARLDDGPEKLVARLLDGEVEGTWNVPDEGTVVIRAVPGSAAAPAGRSHTVTHAIVGSLAPPAAPTGVTLRAIGGGYVARWAASGAPDYAYTEILDGAADDDAEDGGLSAATSRGTVSGTVFSRTDAPTALRVWVRHVDRQGVVGAATHADVVPNPGGGAEWLNLSRDPLAADGDNGDWAINENSYDIFQKVAGSWQRRGNIRGAPGTPGANAADGAVSIWLLTEARRTAPVVTLPASVVWNTQTQRAANDIAPWVDQEPVDYDPYQQVKWRAVAPQSAGTRGTNRLTFDDEDFAPPYVADIFSSTNVLYRRGAKPAELPDEDGAD